VVRAALVFKWQNLAVKCVGSKQNGVQTSLGLGGLNGSKSTGSAVGLGSG
jgi:hypothetical protein